MTYRCTKFHMPTSEQFINVCHLIEAKSRFHAAPILFYILENTSLTKAPYLSKSYYYTLFLHPKLRGGGMAHTSQVCTYAMLLPVAGN
jgi:hypothetical protein